MARKSTKITLAVVFSLVAAAIVCLTLLPRLQSLANGKIDEALGSLDESVYSITGLRVSYDYIELSSTDHIAMHGIKLYQDEAGATGKTRRNVISIDDLRLKFNIWGILLNKPQDLIRGIDLEHLDIAFRLPEDNEPLNKIIKYLFFEPVEYIPEFLLNIDDIRASLVTTASGTSGKPGQLEDRYLIVAPHFQTSTLSGAMEFSIPEAKASGRVPSILTSLDPSLKVLLGSGQFSADFKTVNVWVSPDFTQIDVKGRLAASMGSVAIAEQSVTVKKTNDGIEAELRNGRGL
ncbi:MAG: hypothetical protein LLF89_05875, partial [Spirochaetaceae bacterium]|nr:hypothetical protein [Spirochaetaceae bacterium]